MSTPLRVLIVEDSEDDAALVVRELQHGGFKPEFARVDTAAAMSAALTREKWDIVLCDYAMPQFSGPEALQLLQQSGLDIPFILVSGKIGEEEAVAVMRAGADDFLFKDRLRRLALAIKQELHNAELRREHQRIEEELEAHDILLTALINSSADTIIFSLDRDYRYTAFNEKHRSEMRKVWHADIAVGMSLLDFMTVPELRQLAKQSMDRALQGETISEIQHQPEPDIYYEFSWNPIREKDGNIIGVTALVRDITARKKMEEKIVYLASFPELNPNPILELDQEGNLRYLNPATKSIFPDLAALGVNHPFLVDWAQVVKELQSNNWTKTITREVGVGSLCYEQMISPVAVNQIRVYTRDITARKRAEEARKQSEQNFHNSVEDSPLGVRIHLQGGESLYVNKAFLDTYGYDSLEEFNATPLSKRTTPESYAAIRERQEKEKQGQLFPGFFEQDIVRKDGEIRHLIVWRKDVIWDGQRRDLRLSEDITEQKQAEEALKQSEQNFHNSLDGSPMGVCIATYDGEVLYANKALLELYGYGSVAEFNTTPLSQRTTPESYAAVLERRKKKKRGEPIPDSHEHDIVRKDGEIRHIRNWRKETIWGNRSQALVLSEDITEQKKAVEKIQKLYSLLFAIRKINQSLLQVESELALFQEVCNHLVEVDWVRFAWVGLVQEGTYEVKPAAYAGFEEGYLAAIRVTWDDTDYGRGPSGTAIKTGQPIIVRDMASDLRYHPWREEALRRGYASHISLPLEHDNQTIGVLNVYSGKKDTFGDEEVEFLKEVANDVAVGIKASRLGKSLRQSVEGTRKALTGSVETITSICELRDPYTAGHERAVARLACAIAVEMGLPEKQIEGIWITGCIHDIGKVGVPAEILSKPRKLVDYEFASIRSHPEVAYDILKGLDFPWPVAQAVLQHHERLDGSGYPAGLTGKNIILEAKILAVADVVEAMSSHRPYRPALGIDRALLELLQKKGTLYDPQVVDVCMRLFTEKGFKLTDVPNGKWEGEGTGQIIS